MTPRAAASASPALPELELDVPARPARRAAAPRKAQEEEVSLELAVDPRALAQSARVEPPMPVQPLARRERSANEVGDVAFDARLLADFGDPPRHWLLSPLYAWRVLRRQRELRQILAGRREEAARAAGEAEDALVAFTERVRPVAEKQPALAAALEELRRAEDLLRSRDRVLAAEQDAQSARIASVDTRLASLEADLVRAQADDRAIAADLASAQAALARGEAKLKRAETELRVAQKQEASGTQE